MNTILITGSNGFLGSFLCNYFFTQNNYKLIGLVRSTSDRYRINHMSSLIDIYEIDKVDLEFIFSKHKIDIIINTVCNYGRNNSTYDELLHSNFIFGKNLIDSAINYNVDLFINTDTLLPNNLNPYSETKTLFRNYMKSLNFDLKVLNLRIDHMYGPKDDNNKFIQWLIDEIRYTSNQIGLTSGEQLRDFIYIDDVVEAYHHIIMNKSIFKSKYNELDLITNCLTPMKEIITLLAEKLSNVDKKLYLSRLSFGEKKYRKNEPMRPKLSNKSLTSLGWKPKYDLETGLNKVVMKQLYKK